MDLSFLPIKYTNAIKNIDINYLYEIRLRTGYAVKVNYNNKNAYLSFYGLTQNCKDAIICSSFDISEIIKNVTEHSLYAFNDRIKEGFITTKHGVRIGIAGECVFCENKIQTIKNFSSLNIRIPHQINGCSSGVIKEIINQGKVNNTLIISPPFLGKTTLLKDIATELNKVVNLPILIIDERGEFNNIEGENIDKITYSNKNYAFNYGLRSLSPSVVITDELSNSEDWLCVKNAVNSGIKIIASCHSDCLENLASKNCFIKNLFDRYIVLSNNGEFGKVEKVFNKELNEVWGFFWV